MAKSGRWTVNGRCRWCGRAIAWVQRSDGSYGRPQDATLDAQGRPVIRRDAAGKLRTVGSGEAHHCEQSDAFARASAEEHAKAVQTATQAAQAAQAGHEAAQAAASAQDVTEDAQAASAGTGLTREAIEAAGAMIRAEILARLGKAETLVIQDDTGKVLGRSDETRHPMVRDLVWLLGRKRHVYLYGPAGSGKTYAAEQAARLLGLRSVVLPCAGASVGRILGFRAADGKETPTAFADFWQNGGVVVLDEFDRMTPSAAAAFNSQLANGVWLINEQAVPAHERFLVVANGNTDLRGSTEEYVSAQAMDTATISRFAFLEWPYDEATETALCLARCPSFEPALAWIRSIRAQLKTDGVSTVVAGTREALRMAEDVAAGAKLADAAAWWIWRGYPDADVKRYLSSYPLPKLAK